MFASASPSRHACLTACLALAVLLAASPAFAAGPAPAAGPAFDCSRSPKGSIEADVCKSKELSALDRALAEVFKAATKAAANEHPPTLRAEQRGWIKGRNDCWKSKDRAECIAESYRLRIAELEARYRLVPSSGPRWYSCDDAPGSEVVVTHFSTQPPTLIAERGDATSLMYCQPTAKGQVCLGRNESVEERDADILVVWGYQAQPMRCIPAQPQPAR